MVRIRWMMILLAVGFVATFISTASAAAGTEDVPRMTKDELKAMLESPDLVLVDVRRGQDWDASEVKIPGAERKDPGKFDDWKDQLPKDKAVVLYCA